MPAPTTCLPVNLYRAQGVRALDRAAMERCGISGAMLMERAGSAAFAVLRERWPRVRRIAVVCGTGNNGGDGFVIARLAHSAGVEAAVQLVGARENVRDDARTQLDNLERAGVALQPWRDALPSNADVIVDALLGTGLDRDVEGEHAAAIGAMNASGIPVLAVDIPSGLKADTGAPLGAAVHAAATVTFIGMKQGLLTGAAPDFCGRLYFADLDVPAMVHEAITPSALRITRGGLLDKLKPRRRSGHKGHYGHVLVIGGDAGYVGAVRLAGEAAARVGAGLVSIATRSAHAASIAAACPVLMSHGVETARDLDAVLARATVIAIGPGLGQGAWALGLMARVLESQAPLVMDADALNLLAREPVRLRKCVLTPHPGEAARLLASDTKIVESDRYAAAKHIQSRYGGVCVLKGAGSIVADADGPLRVCDAGNPGMGTGGMGDVLTGAIAGLIAQGLTLHDSACLGVCLHAEAADAAAVDGERGLIASDVLPRLRQLVNS